MRARRWRPLRPHSSARPRAITCCRNTTTRQQQKPIPPDGFIRDAAFQYSERYFEERYLEPISLIANLMPSLGFLGTIIGMVIHFLSNTGTLNSNLTVTGIATALYTTFIGLVCYTTLEFCSRSFIPWAASASTRDWRRWPTGRLRSTGEKGGLSDEKRKEHAWLFAFTDLAFLLLISLSMIPSAPADISLHFAEMNLPEVPDNQNLQPMAEQPEAWELRIMPVSAEHPVPYRLARAGEAGKGWNSMRAPSSRPWRSCGRTRPGRSCCRRKPPSARTSSSPPER